MKALEKGAHVSIWLKRLYNNTVLNGPHPDATHVDATLTNRNRHLWCERELARRRRKPEPRLTLEFDRLRCVGREKKKKKIRQMFMSAVKLRARLAMDPPPVDVTPSTLRLPKLI